jgi:calcium binding protein 39
MTRYIASEANLKMMMNLLRDKSKNIQFEAFHVFKVFVANPKKPAPIETILRRNKDKLLVFLQGFHNDKEGPCPPPSLVPFVRGLTEMCR